MPRLFSLQLHPCKSTWAERKSAINATKRIHRVNGNSGVRKSPNAVLFRWRNMLQERRKPSVPPFWLATRWDSSSNADKKPLRRTIRMFSFAPSRNSTRKVPWSNVMPMVSEKPSIRTSNAATVFTSVAERPSATNTRRRHAHHHVIIWSVQKFAYLSLLFIVAEITEKKEVKACFQCKGADACRPERLDGSEIRTSGAFGASNLYCYTVGWRTARPVLDLLLLLPL